MLPYVARTGLAARLRRPAIWGGFFAFYVVYNFVNIRADLAAGLLSPGWPWVHELMVPALFMGGTVWLGPIPWEWYEGESHPPAFWKGLLRASLFAAAWMVVLTLHGALFRRLGGLPWGGWQEYPVYLSFQAPMMVAVGGLLAAWERALRGQARAQALARETQAKLLQGQLNPHVLFNALNGLAELTLREPAAAERSIRALADFMRKVLEATEEGRYTLGDERAMLQDYLDAEALRLRSRLEVSWDWEEDLDNLPLLPLLLQPLVENALKHGIAPLEEGGHLQLRSHLEEGRLKLEVRNTGAGLPATVNPRVGLRNVQGRLALAYGDGASFELRQEGAWTVGEIGLELHVIGANDGLA